MSGSENFATKLLAENLRKELNIAADVMVAGLHAEEIVNLIGYKLKELADPKQSRGANVATQLLTRALIARGMLAIGAEWWANIRKDENTAKYHEALRSFLDRMPDELEAEITRAGVQ